MSLQKTLGRKLLVMSILLPLIFYGGATLFAHFSGGRLVFLGFEIEATYETRELTLLLFCVPLYLIFWLKTLIDFIKSPN